MSAFIDRYSAGSHWNDALTPPPRYSALEQIRHDSHFGLTLGEHGDVDYRKIFNAFLVPVTMASR